MLSFLSTLNRGLTDFVDRDIDEHDRMAQQQTIQ